MRNRHIQIHKVILETGKDVMRSLPKLAVLVAVVTFQHLAVAQPVGVPPPEWEKDLVIYEIATKSFTSPDGPESGTFESLRARLPYLQDLGITGIWLTGHSLAD